MKPAAGWLLRLVLWGEATHSACRPQLPACPRSAGRKVAAVLYSFSRAAQGAIALSSL